MNPVTFAAGVCEACHQPSPDRIVAGWCYDRDGFGHTLERLSQKLTSTRDDHIELATDQFRRDLVNPLESALRRSPRHHQILALDVSEVAQTAQKDSSDGINRVRPVISERGTELKNQ